MDQQGSPYSHIFLTVIPNYHIKVTTLGALYAEKIAEAVVLYMFRISLAASLLVTKLYMQVVIRRFFSPCLAFFLAQESPQTNLVFTPSFIFHTCSNLIDPLDLPSCLKFVGSVIPPRVKKSLQSKNCQKKYHLRLSQ